jgi:hypothetical protein
MLTLVSWVGLGDEDREEGDGHIVRRAVVVAPN